MHFNFISCDDEYFEVKAFYSRKLDFFIFIIVGFLHFVQSQNNVGYKQRLSLLRVMTMNFISIYTFNKNFDLLVTTFQQHVDVHNYFGCKMLHVCNCRLKKKFCKVGWWQCKISRWWLWMKKVVEPFLEHFSHHYYNMCMINICKVNIQIWNIEICWGLLWSNIKHWGKHL